MLKDLRGAISRGGSEERPGWKVYSSSRLGRSLYGGRLNAVRGLGHLRVLIGEAGSPNEERLDPEASVPEVSLPSADSGEGPMPKRQHQAKRAFKDDFSDSDEQAGLEDDTPNIQREFILTQSADDILQDAVRLFSRATGTNLTNSHFLRVLLKCVAHAMPELKEEVSTIGKLKRPSNSREAQAAREDFERTIAATVSSAFRSAPVYDAETGGRGKGRGSGKRSA